MMTIKKSTFVLKSIVCIGGLVLCLGHSDSHAAAPKPLRTAVFVDAGTRDSALAYTAFFALSPDCTCICVDGASVRAGALREVDLLAMPGESSAAISQSLGEDGRAELVRFIREGGAYVGSCAGALLMMKTEKFCGLGLVPFTRVNAPARGEATIRTIYTEAAQKLAGIPAGRHTSLYNRGPVLDPCTDDPRLGDFTVMARFGCNVLTSVIDPKCPTMGDCPSAVAGPCGRGRIWIFSDHPESADSSWHLLDGACRYLTGRTIRHTPHQYRTGQLNVGWFTGSPGAATAALAIDLLHDDDFHLRTIGAPSSGGTIRHLDALVYGDSPDAHRLAALSTPSAERGLAEFMDAGGSVVAWGRGAAALPASARRHANYRGVSSPTEAYRTLKAVRSAPVADGKGKPCNKASAPAEKTVRTAFLLDRGCSGRSVFTTIRLLASTPGFEVFFVNGQRVRDGALKDADLYIAPGGGAMSQARALDVAGCSNLVAWIRGGGCYYGTCAGAYLVSQPRANQLGKPIRYLGLIPYDPQMCPYRGGTDALLCRYTDDAAALWGVRPGRFSTRYHGGPVLLHNPAAAAPDTDIRTIAAFDCQNLYAFDTNTLPAMAGHAAIVAGRVGKGRLVAVAPHPETFEETQHVVRSGLEYLTGRTVRPAYPRRGRTDRCVGFYAETMRQTDIGTLALRLLKLDSLDLVGVDEESFGRDGGRHLEAVVLPHPTRDDAETVRDFARRGGRIYAYCTTDAERATARTLGAVCLFDDPEALAKALQRQR